MAAQMFEAEMGQAPITHKAGSIRHDVGPRGFALLALLVDECQGAQAP